jgi:Predicted Zn-dependent proteases and their inactivated homologs
LFFEDTKSSVIRVVTGDVASIDVNNTFGVGVRLIQGVDVVYGYSNDTSYPAIETLLTSLRASFTGPSGRVAPLNQATAVTSSIKRHRLKFRQVKKQHC